MDNFVLKGELKILTNTKMKSEISDLKINFNGTKQRLIQVERVASLSL